MDVSYQVGQPPSAGNAGDLLRLAPTQEVQWEEMCAESPANPGASRNLVMGCRVFQGRLDDGRFDAAVAGVIRRHDALRLVFEHVGLDPTMRARDDVAIPLSRHDVRGPRADEDANALLWRMYTAPFDAGAQPWWRMSIIRLNDEKHVVSVLFSHVVADGFSCAVFFRDLVAHYVGTSASLPPAPSMQEIIARQQQRYATTPERLDFWRKQVASIFEISRLLPDRRPPLVDALRRKFVFFDLAEDCVVGVRRTAWRARTTPFVTLLSAYHLTLSLMTGKRATLIVTSTTGRRDALDRAAVFQMASYPYVVLDVADDDTLLGLARRAHANLDAAIANVMPYTELAAAVNPAFGASRPWPDVNLVDGIFHSWPHSGDEIVAPGLVVTPVDNPVPPPSETIVGPRRGVPPSGDLPPELAGCRPGLTVSVERDSCVVFFNDQLYSEAAMDRFVAAFTWLAERFASAPDLKVRQVADDFETRFGVIDPVMEQTQ
ncbi:condensation domain-containing protein [Streptomyces sp. 7N604]|uniref:condensation domain-containing protein n=1 Tax=Streptomyces sp. 7N604 TaxID=3457415 RepID=UPI003FD53155